MAFRFSTITVIALGAILALSTPTFAQDTEQALKALEDALPGTLIHNPYELEWVSRGPNKKIKVINAPEMSTGKALSAKIKKKSNKPWDVTVFTEIAGAVEAGEEIEAHFYARTAKPRAGQDTATTVLFIGRNEEPYDYIISEEIKPSKEWKLHTVRGTAKKGYSENSIKAEYQLGQGSQTIEFGPIYISKL